MRVSRWYRMLGISLMAIVMGAATGNAAYLLAALVPVGFTAYSALSTTPGGSVRVHRSITPEKPAPGEEATVRLTVENPSEEPLTDVRIVDGVPDALEVVAGSPRVHLALRGEASTEIEYTVVTRRGDHEFVDPTVRYRGIAASAVTTEQVTTTGATTLRGRLAVDEPPLTAQTLQYAGQVPTTSGGSGVEFFSTREYQRGDPMSRVDWHRLAKTGTLTTVEFLEHRAAMVVFVIDDRETTQVAQAPGHLTALELSAYAATRGIDALTSAGTRAGLATITSDAWVPPRATAETTVKVADELATIGSGSGATVRADGGTYRSLLSKLPRSSQVYLVSPLLDDEPLDLARTLREYGHAVTVLSPDVTGGTSLGAREERLRRRVRVATCRGSGIPLVDWDDDEPLDLAIARSRTTRTRGGGR